MRTTLTLDDDVADFLKQQSQHLNQPFKQVVNDFLRRGMAGGSASKSSEPFTIIPHESDFCIGVDPMKLNQLVDEMDAEDLLTKVAK